MNAIQQPLPAHNIMNKEEMAMGIVVGMLIPWVRGWGRGTSRRTTVAPVSPVASTSVCTRDNGDAATNS